MQVKSLKILMAAVLAAFLVYAVQPAMAASSDEEAQAARIEGFRTAHFGISEKEVKKQVQNEFGLDDKSVTREENSLEKTASLIVQVKDLIPDSGPSRIAYIFGFTSKKLIQVNILWGDPVDNTATPEKLVATARILSNYFRAAGYKNVVVNQPVEVGATVVFRGTDDDGRMVLLLLNAQRASDEQVAEGAAPQRVSLRLSYMENPTNPDIFRVEKGQF
jgi:hypothetical protein